MAQISCKKLCIGYDNLDVVINLKFEVNTGDYLAIVGENGAGKSTLIKTILGLIKPLSGEIIFGDGLVKNEIGYLPQQTVVQKDFPASCFEVVLSGFVSKLGFKPFYNKELKNKALERMKEMGLEGLEKTSYKELSGGQQQKVLLARAICSTTKVLILDEPVSGLDPKATGEMYELISNLNKKGITIIMISHDVNSSIKFANKILHIGSNTFFGSKDDYITSDLGKRFIHLGGKCCDRIIE